jgi:hypothetical protein
MDMFTVSLNNNREYVVTTTEASLTDEDVFHILRRMVFDMEQKRLAKELAGQVAPSESNVASLIRKRLSDRKTNS